MNDSLKQFYTDNSRLDDHGLSAEAKERIKFSLMTKIANLPGTEYMQAATSTTNGKLFTMHNFRNLVTKSYVVAPLTIILLIAGTTAASANSLPGDPLYTFKRSVETVAVLIAPTEETKTELKVNFAKRRISELETLQARGDIDKADQPNDDSSKKVQTPPSGTNIITPNNITTPATPPSLPTKAKVDENENKQFYRHLSPEVKKQIETEAGNAKRFLENSVPQVKGAETNTQSEIQVKLPYSSDQPTSTNTPTTTTPTITTPVIPIPPVNSTLNIKF